MVNILDEIKTLTSSVDFPIGKDDLVKVAREKGLPAPVIGLLERFTDKEYQSEKEVKQEATQQTDSSLGGLGKFLR